MSTFEIYPTAGDLYYIAKFAASILGGLMIAAGCTACGVSTGSGFVAGTTTYLQEYNRGQHSVRFEPPERITEGERLALDRTINGRAR